MVATCVCFILLMLCLNRLMLLFLPYWSCNCSEGSPASIALLWPTGRTHCTVEGPAYMLGTILYSAPPPPLLNNGWCHGGHMCVLFCVCFILLCLNRLMLLFLPYWSCNCSEGSPVSIALLWPTGRTHCTAEGPAYMLGTILYSAPPPPFK